MSKRNLYFLARCDELTPIQASLGKLYNIDLANIVATGSLIENICVVELSFSGQMAIKSMRHMNILPIDEQTAQKFTNAENVNEDLKDLVVRLEKIDNREKFNYLLELLGVEPTSLRWLK